MTTKKNGSVFGGFLKASKSTRVLLSITLGLFALALVGGAVLLTTNPPSGKPIGAYGYANPFVYLYGRRVGDSYFNTGSITITSGQSIQLYWQAGNLDHCKAGSYPWTSATGLTSPVVTLGPLIKSTTYVVNCYPRANSDSGSVVTAQIQVLVQPGGYGYNYINTSLDPASPVGYLNAGNTGAELFRFDITAPTPNLYYISKMTMDVGGSLPLSRLANIRLLDEKNNVLGIYNVASQQLVFAFKNPIAFTAGPPRVFRIVGDISPKAPKSTIFVRLNGLALAPTGTQAPVGGLPVVGNLLGILAQ